MWRASVRRPNSSMCWQWCAPTNCSIRPNLNFVIRVSSAEKSSPRQFHSKINFDCIFILLDFFCSRRHASVWIGFDHWRGGSERNSIGTEVMPCGGCSPRRHQIPNTFQPCAVCAHTVRLSIYIDQSKSSAAAHDIRFAVQLHQFTELDRFVGTTFHISNERIAVGAVP